MVLRSLCRLGKVIASRSTTRSLQNFQIKPSQPFQARFISCNPIRLFNSMPDSVESLQLKVAQIEEEQGEASPYLIVPYNKLGSAYRDREDFPKAALYFEKAVKIAEKLEEADPEDLEVGYMNLGHAYEELEDAENSIKYFNKALEIAKKLHGEGSREVAILYNNLATVYRCIDNIEAAYECLQKALPFMETELQSADEDVATYFANRGHVCGLKYKPTEAVKSFQRARKIFEKLDGPITEECADMDHYLALAQWSNEEFSEAVQSLERAIGIKRALGKVDDFLIELHKKLGFLYKELNNIRKSEEAFEKGAEVVKELAGDNARALAYYYNHIGNNCRMMGDSKSGKVFFDKCYEIMKTLEDENTKDMGICYDNLSADAHDSKELDKALEFGLKALDIKRNAKCAAEDIATTLTQIGTVYHTKGDYSQAENYLMEAKQMLEGANLEDESILDSCLSTIGLLYRDQGKFQESLDMYHRALEIKAKNLGEVHPALANTYAHIGIVYDKNNKFPEAIEQFNKAIDMNTKTLGREHPSTATYLDLVADAYRNSGKVEAAIKEHEFALEIRRNVFGEKDFMIGLSYNNLAFDYRALKDWEKAIEYHNRSKDVYQAVYGDKHPYYGGGFVLVGEVYEELGNKAKALENYEKGKEFFIGLYGDNNDFVKNILVRIEKLKISHR